MSQRSQITRASMVADAPDSAWAANTVSAKPIATATYGAGDIFRATNLNTVPPASLARVRRSPARKICPVRSQSGSMSRLLLHLLVWRAGAEIGGPCRTLARSLPHRLDLLPREPIAAAHHAAALATWQHSPQYMSDTTAPRRRRGDGRACEALIRREPLPRKSCALGHGAWLSNTGRTPQSSGSHRILARYPLIRKKSER